MTHKEVKFRLTESQMKRLHHAHKIGDGVSFRLSKEMITPNGIPLLLTGAEYDKIMSGGTHQIKISATRVKHGGFLPALIAALPTVAAAIGGVSGLASIASSIKNLVGKGSPRAYMGTRRHIRKHLNKSMIMPPVIEHRQIPHVHPIGQSQKASGIISDLNLPIISPLAKIIGLGTKKRRKKGAALYWK
jgi:hypothetical protein